MKATISIRLHSIDLMYVRETEIDILLERLYGSFIQNIVSLHTEKYLKIALVKM